MGARKKSCFTIDIETAGSPKRMYRAQTCIFIFGKGEGIVFSAIGASLPYNLVGQKNVKRFWEKE
jgi:hypothetical protein